jgi:hypothetical protein
MLAERRWSPDQRLGPLDLQFRREPRLPQDPGTRSTAREKVKPCGKMLRQRCQQRIPPLITDGRGLVPQKRRLSLSWLPSVLLEELPYELPPHPSVSCPRHAAAQFGQVIGS